MARPRTASDARILEATRIAVTRLGPFRMTLADVARGAGITASAIVQRFGTKRALLLQLVEADARRIEQGFAGNERSPPLKALMDGLCREAAFASPESIAGGLAFLSLDVTDEEFRHHALSFFDARGRLIRDLLDEARDRGELSHPDLDALSRAIDVAYHGSLIRWALARDGAADEAVRRDLEAVLAPHRRQLSRSPASAPRGRSPPPSPNRQGRRSTTRPPRVRRRS